MARAAAPLFLLLLRAAAQAPSSPWTGNMHPTVTGFTKTTCALNRTGSCTATYDDLAAAGALWACPRGDATAASCAAPGGGCVPGTGDNPLCAGRLNASSPCCCAAPGCAATPQFNWIIGVCKGASCACGGASTRAASCAPEGEPTRCGDARGAPCSGPSVACCFGANVEPLVPYYDEGTHAVVNYIASYQFDATARVWRIVEESSFNTDGSRGAFDMMKPFGGLSEADAWLAPQPGGAVFWSLGYYPTGVKGVGPPGAMFVLSTEDWFGGTFYMLNQLALDRGPGTSMPKERCAVTNSNCWASGNSGEMDFLEPGWNNPSTAQLQYTQSFSTQNNQIGRCFVGGANGGGFSSSNWLSTEASPLSGAPPEPTLYVAVVDSVGVWVYRIPAADAPTLWPGLGRKGANATVQAAPTRVVDAMNPGNASFAATFTSNCQATNVADARAQGCGFNGDQGFCGNFFAGFADTRQPLYPSADCERDVRGGKTMPWCKAALGARAAAADATAECPAARARTAAVEAWVAA